MKNGDPPDKFDVLHRLLPIGFQGFTRRIDFKFLLLFNSCYFVNFLKGPIPSILEVNFT